MAGMPATGISSGGTVASTAVWSSAVGAGLSGREDAKGQLRGLFFVDEAIAFDRHIDVVVSPWIIEPHT